MLSAVYIPKPLVVGLLLLLALKENKYLAFTSWGITALPPSLYSSKYSLSDKLSLVLVNFTLIFSFSRYSFTFSAKASVISLSLVPLAVIPLSIPPAAGSKTTS